MFLQLKNLTKEYNKEKVVNDLSLDIEKGEILCLLGPSGCGKTTTLKIIGGFIEPQSGQVYIDGEEITRIPSEKRPASTVFQSYALFPHMNVIENVSYGLKFKGIGKTERIEKAKEYLEIVGLKEYEKSKIQELSGGQQQRVALARSLVISPKVLLLDEPLSNLDAKLREKMRKEIKDLQRKLNITMVFVTHDQEEALALGDKIAVMNKGCLEQIGSPKEIYVNPQSSFVLNFIGNSNIYKENNKEYFVRPENMLLRKDKGDFKGIIVGKTFMGSYTNYYVKYENGFLNIKHQNLDHKDTFQIDEQVYVEILYRCINN